MLITIFATAATNVTIFAAKPPPRGFVDFCEFLDPMRSAQSGTEKCR